jgi:hypothetical protein
MVISASTTIAIGASVVLNSTDSLGNVWLINRNGFTGWGSPASTIAPRARPRQRGASAGDAFDMPRVMTITGTIRSLTPDMLNAAIDLLLASVTLAEFTMTVSENGRVRSCRPRRQGETLALKITNLMASYSIQIEAMDPRKMGVPLTASTGLPVSSGGFVVPEVWPLVIASGAASGQISLTNSGSEVGPVVARVDGPCGPFNVAHTSTVNGVTSTSTFSSSLALNAGEFDLIDMEARTMMANGQSSRSPYISSRAWSNFDPGLNTWTFTASSYNAASLLTITATPAN